MRYDADTALFEITVYRSSFEKWADEYDAEVAERAAPLVRSGDDPERAERWARSFVERRRGGWTYTQAVGWIQLLSDGHDVVKGELWWTDKTRIMETPRPTRFEYESKILECWIPEECTDFEVAAKVREALLNVRREHHLLRRRYLDLRAYDRAAPYLKWSEALGWGRAFAPGAGLDQDGAGVDA